MGRIPYRHVALAKILCLILLFCWPLFAQDTLIEADQREILLRLYELQNARQQMASQQQYISKIEELDKRQGEFHAKEIDLYKGHLDLEKQRSAMLQEQVGFYKGAYEAVTRKRSAKCVIAKIFTLGIARCGP